MGTEDLTRKAFLQELYKRAEGDFASQISMHDLGSDLGLGEDEVAAFAQDLFIEGLAEMKTLSGGMGITQKGLDALDIKIVPKNKDQFFRLESSLVLDSKGEKVIHELLSKIRSDLDSKALPFGLMEEIILDIKTIEVQMLSPNPKTLILKEIFKFMEQNIKNFVSPELKLELQTIIS